MSLRSMFRSAVMLGFAAALWLAPATSSAQAAEWDQERVTAIAKELAAAMKDLRNTVRKNPDDLSLAQRRAQYEAREDLRLLENTTRHLAAELAAGEGREATLPIHRRIETLRRDAEENGRRAMIPEATMEKIVVAKELLIRIAPYYAEE